MTLTTSLLMATTSTPDLDETPEPENNDEEPSVSFMGNGSQRLLGLAATVAIVFNVIVLLGAMAPLAIVNTALVVCFSLRVVSNEYQIANMGTLRYYINKMRQTADRLGGENDKLSSSNDRLEEETEKLKGIEEELGSIADEQGVQMEDFMNIMKENQEVLDAMKRTLDRLIHQNLTGFIIDADLSHNHNIDGPEIDLLLHRLDAFDYFDVNEEALRKIISDNKGDIYEIITDIIEIMKETEEGGANKLIHKNEDNVVHDSRKSLCASESEYSHAAEAVRTNLKDIDEEDSDYSDEG